MAENGPEWLRMDQNDPEMAQNGTEIGQNGSEWTKMDQNGPKWLRNGPEWLRMTLNGSE
jgi:hypothetical protein